MGRSEAQVPTHGPQGRGYNRNSSRLVTADLNAGIVSQLIGDLPVSVSFHLSLIYGQDRAVPCDRDDVTFAHPLLEMRSGNRHVLVIGIVPLILQFHHWPISQCRPGRERAHSHTQN